MNLIPFQVEHFEVLKNSQELMLVSLDERRIYQQVASCALNPSFTGMINGEVVGAAGLWHLWKGVAEAWAIMGSKAVNHPYAVQKALKRGLVALSEAMGLHRIQAVMRIDNLRGLKWLKTLGFEQEGEPMKGYGPDGADYYRLAIVRTICRS